MTMSKSTSDLFQSSDGNESASPKDRHKRPSESDGCDSPRKCGLYSLSTNPTQIVFLEDFRIEYRRLDPKRSDTEQTEMMNTELSFKIKEGYSFFLSAIYLINETGDPLELLEVKHVKLKVQQSVRGYLGGHPYRLASFERLILHVPDGDLLFSFKRSSAGYSRSTLLPKEDTPLCLEDENVSIHAKEGTPWNFIAGLAYKIVPTHTVASIVQTPPRKNTCDNDPKTGGKSIDKGSQTGGN